MQTHRKSLQLIRILSDCFVISFSIIVTGIITGKTIDVYSFSEVSLLLVFISSWVYFGFADGLYNEFRSRHFGFEFLALFKNILVQFVLFVFVIFLFKRLDYSRTFVFIYLITALVLLTGEKLSIRIVLEYLRKKGRNLRNLLIVGAGDLGIDFVNSVKKNPNFGYRIVGFLDDEKKTFLNGEYLGKIEDLDSLLEERQVDDVIIALPNYAHTRFNYIIGTCEQHTTRVKIIPDYFKYVTNSKYSVTMFDRFPIISVRDDKLNEFQCRLFKRFFDIIFSSLVIIFIFSWLYPIIALAIKLSSPGQVLFKQMRWGRNNKHFTALKFRSMQSNSKDTDENGKFNQATKNDPRITKIGKFLRKSNLDELPQFFNVLVGDMSVIGPRPHPGPLNLENKKKIRRYMLRHLVKPGITGWAQVNGYRGETKEKELMQKRIDYDIWYIEHWSVWLDLQIVFLTIWRMIKGDPRAY